jgi:hypothetical protein
MIVRVKEKLNHAMKIIRKKIFHLNDFENISRDQLLCREYIDYELLDKGKRKWEDLVKTMVKGCSVLEQIGVKYWIGRGSLLGFHRDDNFLPSDIDIDIDVYSDRDVYKIIKIMPFDILLVTSNRGQYMQLSFLDSDTNVIFDIWFYHERDGRLYNRNFFGSFWLPSERFNEFESIQFNDREYPVPNPDWYCQYWYGDNWRIPKKYGKDWTIDYRKDCKAFVYTGAKNLRSIQYYKPQP